MWLIIITLGALLGWYLDLKNIIKSPAFFYTLGFIIGVIVGVLIILNQINL